MATGLAAVQRGKQKHGQAEQWKEWAFQGFPGDSEGTCNKKSCLLKVAD